MRLKMICPYDRFPNHNMVAGEPYLTCYNDFHVKDSFIEPNSIALMIEPRSLQPQSYRYLENNYHKFKLIFTHDSILLSTLPNAFPIIRGCVWGERFNDKPKTKNISFCSSAKTMCHIHKLRKQLAFDLEHTIDCMGTYNGGKEVTTSEIYADYKFSVVIENFIDDIWFTEKICYAFSNKCVPIYYGARDIGKFFNLDGIIQVKNLYDIPMVVDKILEDVDEEYNKRRDAINENYEIVKNYTDFEKWFFDRYDGLLEDPSKAPIWSKEL